MNRLLASLFSAGLLIALASACSLQAAEPADAESRLRDALRSSALQLRDVQGQLAQAQAARADADRQVAELKDKVAAITKTAAAAQTESDKTTATLKTRVAEQDASLVRFKEAVAKYEVAYKQAVEVATKTEAERVRLADLNLQLGRKVAARETENIALFKVGCEILTRYEKFSLGEALMAREPFVGLTRVKLENLVQDYHGQLLDHKVRSDN